MKKLTAIEYKYSKNRESILWNALSEESKTLALEALELDNQLNRIDTTTSWENGRDFDKSFIKQFVMYLPDEDCYLIK